MNNNFSARLGVFGALFANRAMVWSGAVAVAVYAVVLPRLIPTRYLDRGIFVSVGERLLAGDVLYREVYDNKDPLFYYLVAAERALGTWAEIVTEALLLGIVAGSAYLITKLVAPRSVAAAIAFIAVPLIATGKFYFPGYTHLPGIALVMLISAAAAKGRPVLSGVSFAVLLFTKFIFIPLAAAPAGCFFMARRRAPELAWFAFAAASTAILLVSILAARGELGPYVGILISNIRYSHGALVEHKAGLALLNAHIRLLGPEFTRELVAITLVILVAVLSLGHLTKIDRMEAAILGSAVLSMLGSIFVLSTTGLFDHHNQTWYIPAIFGMLALAPLMTTLLARAPMRTVGLIVLTAYTLGGPIDPERFLHRSSIAVRYSELNEMSPETKRLLALGQSGSYARLGGNDDYGHARGLGKWRLACARFHQYEFESKAVLDVDLACASRAPVLIVEQSIKPAKFADWNDFVSNVEAVLKQSYVCDSNYGLRVCIRRYVSVI